MARGPMNAPFVARADEVALLVEALDRAGTGMAGAVLLAADAGVGKTRLLQHVAALAAESGAHVVVTHCVDLGDVGLPYLPFAETLAQLRALAPDTVDEIVAARPALARLMPGQAPGDGSANRLQLFEGLVEVLGAVGAEGRPLLLVVEDVHWADASSRDVLRFLVSRLRDQHLLVVASYRTDDLHRRHPWRPAAAELVRHPRVQRLDLPPFTPEELREFTVAVTGSPVAEQELRRVADRSEGNAYFAQELLEAGADADELPWSLADVLRTRLEVLEPEVQQLVRVASVAGRRVDERLLRAAVGEGFAGFDAALREAVAHHVLAVEDDNHLAFRHALLAEAVAADLLPGEVSSLHRAYLRALQADPTLGPSSQLASHALRAPDLPVAWSASRSAAHQAHEVLAPAEELRHLEAVLRLWDAVGEPATADGEDHAAVLSAAATAASAAGLVDRCVQLARAAVEDTADDVPRQAGLRTRLARHLLAAEHLEEAMLEAERALEAVGDDPTPARAWALATYARCALNVDQDEAAVEAGEQAVRVAREAGAGDAESDALTTLAVLVVDDADRAATLLATALDRAREACDLDTELRTTYNLALNRFYAGHLAPSLLLAREGLDRARSVGLGTSTYGLELALSVRLIEYTLGDLSPSPPVADVPDDRTGPLTAVDLYAATARGDDDVPERAAALQPEWVRDGFHALVAGGCAADALTWRGAYDEAVAMALQVIDFLGRAWTDYFLGGIWLSALGLAALADAAAEDRLQGRDPAPRLTVGDALLERALTTAERGRPRGGRLGPEGRAWLARARAEHGRLLGPAGNDPALWADALREFDYGYRYELARTRFRLAESLLEQGDRDGAREHAAIALAEADDMGAVPLAGALRSLSRRGRLTLVGVPNPGADVLTAREAEVLTLVAQGLSNRQIGEKLFISGKTVSVHVSNLLAKLGASGRAEAVSIAHQRGLIGRA
ncbi:helix-turn-helix transcriptional regulator [Cellulomonas edaphi]|uniref:AAA family ATPase n=1 Tax=Cellulomonas edaphi TaxID=3053468 RepID=A0ABT7S447_9CELL|nr:helix-turn-helix transcriptional regulator [Cellulomons edaphi]MDM7830398.1 AAA family ATPase [Cellulomons edaphi]